MKTRIVVYGGADLSPEIQEFVSLLTQHLLAIPDVSILSGGFQHNMRRRNAVSVDACVLKAAEQALSQADMAERFETWLPAPTLDRHSVQRFRKGQVHELTGTSQARRFKLVREADALVTIKGSEHTRSLLELALALQKPALPIAFTGGDSSIIWKRDGEGLRSALRLSPEVAAQLDRQPASKAERARLAATVAAVVHGVAQRRCLVLMPFGGSHDAFYGEHLLPAIERANFVPHRIDQDDYAGDIPTLFRDALSRSSATVVDLSGMNANVLYELGYLQAKGIVPLLLQRRLEAGRRQAELPFYLLHEKVYTASDGTSGRARLAAYLEQYLRSASRPAGAVRR